MASGEVKAVVKKQWEEGKFFTETRFLSGFLQALIKEKKEEKYQFIFTKHSKEHNHVFQQQGKNHRNRESTGP